MFFERKGKASAISIGIFLLVGIVTIGIVGYMFVSDYSFVDAVYMTVITISTVGFREVHNLTPTGKIFTAGLIVSSFGIFGYVLTTVSKFIVDGVFRNYYKDSKVKKRIAKLQNHVIVCGYGRNGSQAVVELLDHDEQVVVLDRSEDVILEIREDTDLLYIQGDATRDEILEMAQVQSAKALITAFPKDSDNLFVVLTAREMNSEMTIISRASKLMTEKKLKRAGATNVIMPDKIGGQRMAKLVAQPDVVEFMEFIMLQQYKDVSIEEVTCENIAKCFMDKSIRELDIRRASGANIVGLRKSDGTYLINPGADTILTSKDKLFVLASPVQISKLYEVLSKEK